jgi:hypothetical protein
MWQDPEFRSWLIVAGLNLPLYLWLGQAFFGSWGGFFGCLRFWLMPDLASLFRGKFLADRWAELKLFVFIAVCVGLVVLEHRFFFPDPPV